ncbi:MAG TPA: hypothetical protein VGV57_09420 [Thermoleophilaceae bacterium]|nr:hypothetical protein [Thermoleophilaceae bacterium]
MIPSEAAIETAVDHLAPGAFQRLAEAYARKAFPSRFGQLTIHGRNPKVQPTPGWPDAYAVRPDGALDALEATRDSRNWRRHLEADIKKAERMSGPRLGGFLFVAWARGPDPSSLRAEVRRLTNAGVAVEDITFVFRADLVAALRAPEHAGTWTHLLGLPTSAWPFEDISRAPIFGARDAQLFAPTKEEFADQAVHTPALAQAVQERLREQRWALVRGRGAAGKTVLGAMIGLEWQRHSDPCYYLDLAPRTEILMTAGPQSALEAVTSRGASNVLFVIDNVHRDEELAAILYHHWRVAGNDSRLLMLSRQADAPGSILGLESPLAPLQREALVLAVQPEDIAAVWRRLTERLGGPSDTTPPNAVLKRWLSVFGGDLIAFSAAVALRHPGPGHWDLDATDARAYVETRYLDPLEPEQRAALVDVADWSALELAQPAETAAPSKLRPSLREGIVERVVEGYAGYRTVHPGVATLLLAASGATPYRTVLDELQGLDHQFAITLARRVADRGDFAAARQILELHLASQGDVLGVLVAGGPRRVSGQLAFLREILGAERLGSLPPGAESIAEIISAVDPDALLAVLSHARAFPALVAAIDVRVAEGPVRSRKKVVADLAAVAGDTHLKALPLVLRWIRRGMPRTHAAVADAVARKNGVERFFATPRRLPAARWHDLARAAEASAPFRHSLTSALAGPRAAIWPLLHAPDALRLLAKLRAVHEDLALALEQHTHRSDFRMAAARNALNGGPGLYLSLLKLAQQYDRELLRVLVNAGTSSERRQAVKRWRGARTKFPRLKAWAAEHSPELAQSILVAEQELDATLDRSLETAT